MKRLLTPLIFIVIVAAPLLYAAPAHAGIKVPVGNMTSLTKVADLPDTDDYKIKDGEYADVGLLYDVYTIAIVPLWVTKDPVLVAYNEKSGQYMQLPEAEMDAVLKKNNLDRGELSSPGFYVRYGGKLIALALLALIVYGMWPSSSKKEKVTPQSV